MTIEKIVKKISLLHSVSTETPTSFNLAREIVNYISIDWSNPDLKILDPGCGRGTFLLAVLEKLEQYHNREHIVKNMLYGCDISKVQYSIAIKALKMTSGVEANISNSDALTKAWNMKFDVVLGNPPYEAASEDGRKDQANNLWSKFVDKGISLVKDGGYFTFIIPTSWLSPAADIGKGKHGTRFFEAYFQKYKTHVLNVNECARHFNVGSTFSYFVLEKTVSNNFNTRVITEEDDFIIDLKTISYLPKSMNPLSIAINKKILEHSDKFGIVGNNLPETRIEMKKDKDEVFSVPCYNTPAKGGTYWFSEAPVATATKSKVIISISGNYVPVYDLGGMSFTGMCIIYYLKDTDNMDSIRSYLESKLIKFVLNENKYTGWVSPVISNLPNIDKTRIWTDQDLYTHFKLTQEEVDYIDAR
jgi:site-specific DNA-methyltransferase (adenine-specific)